MGFIFGLQEVQGTEIQDLAKLYDKFLFEFLLGCLEIKKLCKKTNKQTKMHVEIPYI